MAYGSSIGAGNQSGSAIGTGEFAGLVAEVKWIVITAAPSDTPVVGTMRQYINEGAAAPYRRLYTYSASGWAYVEN